MTAGIMGGIVKQTRGGRSGFLCSNKDTPVPLLALYDELEREGEKFCPDMPRHPDFPLGSDDVPSWIIFTTNPRML